MKFNKLFLLLLVLGANIFAMESDKKEAREYQLIFNIYHRNRPVIRVYTMSFKKLPTLSKIKEEIYEFLPACMKANYKLLNKSLEMTDIKDSDFDSNGKIEIIIV